MEAILILTEKSLVSVRGPVQRKEKGLVAFKCDKSANTAIVICPERTSELNKWQQQHC